VTVEIELAGPPALRSGQIASAACPVRAAPASDPPSPASPPRRCWRLGGQRGFVLRFDNGKARRTAVTFGGFDGDDALVAGLPRGPGDHRRGRLRQPTARQVRVVDRQAGRRREPLAVTFDLAASRSTAGSSPWSPSACW
jgi:multidrug efflux system membrane fusion protein